MIATNSLPDGPQIPVLLRRIKFVTHPIEYVEDFARVYGDSFTLTSRDSSPIVYFSQPEALEQIFTASSNYFDAGRTNQMLRFMLGDNSLILLDGERHQCQRQLLAPPFHGDRMRVYGQAIQEITQKISQKWQNNQPFNIRHSMQEITLEVILRVIFGLDEDQRFHHLRKLLTSILELISSPVGSFTFFFRFLRRDFGEWSPWGQILSLMEQIDEVMYALMGERRLESNQNRQDILSLMMSARYEDGQGMTDVELRDELMTLLIAGHETTSSALTWAFYWIDQLPEVREKLIQELHGISYEPNIIAKLPYLTAVCQETLRIYPIVMTGFIRVVKHPINIMGYELPPGTAIVPSIYLAHHREQVYPQSRLFKPERFLERQFSPYEFLPFGGGNRRCIGMAFAMYEMKIVLATIISRYKVSLVDKRPVRPVRRGLTLAAPVSMRMIATPL
jgi:cytochrome P450